MTRYKAAMMKMVGLYYHLGKCNLNEKMVHLIEIV